MKNILSSKTFWFNLASMVVLAAAYFNQSFLTSIGIPPKWENTILKLLGIGAGAGNILLRMISTGQPINLGSFLNYILGNRQGLPTNDNGNDKSNSRPLSVAFLLIAMCTFASMVQAQSGVIPPNGQRGTIVTNFNPQGNPGNVGDVQISFNGAKGSVTGFNFNPFTSTLLLDSLPATPVPLIFSADTTLGTDTAILNLNYVNIGVTRAGAAGLNYVVILPYTPPPVTPLPQVNYFIDLKFTGTIASLKVISINSAKSRTVLYSAIPVQPGQLFQFSNIGGTWY